MRLLTKIIIFFGTLFISILTTCWSILISIIDFIDGDDETDGHVSDDNTVWYNYRTGETDPIKRIDGIYNDRQ